MGEVPVYITHLVVGPRLKRKGVKYHRYGDSFKRCVCLADMGNLVSRRDYSICVVFFNIHLVFTLQHRQM
jgi:hypothetical protein